MVTFWLWRTVWPLRGQGVTPARAKARNWLEDVTHIRATGDVRAMRDAYETRSGVIAEFRHPGSSDPSWYLFDIDVSGSILLAGAAVFDEADQAAAAWRDAVGASAEGLTPTTLTAEVLTCLVYFDNEEHFIDGGESRAVMDNWFRGRPWPVRG